MAGEGLILSPFLLTPYMFYNLKCSDLVNYVALFFSVILVVYISCAWSADLTSV